MNTLMNSGNRVPQVFGFTSCSVLIIRGENIETRIIVKVGRTM